MEPEWRLDAKLFLEEIPRWCPGDLNHALLYQRMFEHANASGLKKYHRGIHQGHWQPSPEGIPQAEVSTMGLLTLETTLDKILALYQEDYQCRREPGEVQCTEHMVGKAHNEILEAIRAPSDVDGVPSSWWSLDESPEHQGKHSIMPACSCLMTTLISTKPGSNHPEERPQMPTKRCWPLQPCLKGTLSLSIGPPYVLTMDPQMVFQSPVLKKPEVLHE